MYIPPVTLEGVFADILRIRKTPWRKVTPEEVAALRVYLDEILIRCLYNHCRGNASRVVELTGLPDSQVRRYIKLLPKIYEDDNE